MSLAEAVQPSFAFDRHDGACVYIKTFDPVWTMGKAPHGGFVLCVIVAACEEFQKRRASPHVDCSYLSSFFYSPTPTQQTVEVIVKLKRATKSFTYLRAELVVRESRVLLLEVDLIFGVLPAFPAAGLERSHRTLVAPMAGARRTPFTSRPSDLPEGSQPSISNFQDAMRWRHDARIAETTRAAVKGGGEPYELHPIRAGTYIEMKDATPLAHHLLPMFLDMFDSIPDVLGRELTGKSRDWHPTMAFSANFFSRTPDWSQRPEYQGNTLGTFAYGSFTRDGRHESLTEVWTAPSRDSNDPDWRDKQQCLATSTQMALTIPVRNQRANL